MIYKVVDAPHIVEGDPCKVFEELININAQDGWRYHSMETITKVEKGGCFKKEEVYKIYMLIFEKDE